MSRSGQQHRQLSTIPALHSQRFKPFISETYDQVERKILMLLKHRDPDCGGNNDTGVVRTLKHYTCLPYHFHRRRPDRPNRLIVSNLVFSGKKRILVITTVRLK